MRPDRGSTGRKSGRLVFHVLLRIQWPAGTPLVEGATSEPAPRYLHFQAAGNWVLAEGLSSLSPRGAILFPGFGVIVRHVWSGLRLIFAIRLLLVALAFGGCFEVPLG